nr:MAG TPA: hypothetical protein [Caudoviricetes sp.]
MQCIYKLFDRSICKIKKYDSINTNHQLRWLVFFALKLAQIL